RDWSSDVCSSDLNADFDGVPVEALLREEHPGGAWCLADELHDAEDCEKDKHPRHCGSLRRTGLLCVRAVAARWPRLTQKTRAEYEGDSGERGGDEEWQMR